MRTVEVFARSTLCRGCKSQVTRKYAEEHNWIEVIERDAAGMEFERYKLCQTCQKSWHALESPYHPLTSSIPAINKTQVSK